MDYCQIPQDLIFVITGTFLLVVVCRSIGICSFMQYLGQNTLAIYGMNIPIILLVVNILDDIYTPTGKIESIGYLLTLLILYFAFQGFILYVMNKSPLTYISGKWK